MPLNHRPLMFQDWDFCGRCGFQYPLGYLTRQWGMLVCTVTCVDNVENELRPKVIAGVLNNNEELRGKELPPTDNEPRFS